jgi:hypothetical protein
MNTYKVYVSWILTQVLVIEARDKEDAISQAQSSDCDGQYKDGSFTIEEVTKL